MRKLLFLNCSLVALGAAGIAVPAVAQESVAYPQERTHPLPIPVFVPPEEIAGPDLRPKEQGVVEICDGDDCSVIKVTRPLHDMQIIVTATGLPTRLADATQPATVVLINPSQGTDFSQLVQRLPGTSFSRNGGIGGLTSLFVRGASSDELLVLVDGVRVNDVSSPGGGFDFGSLSLGQIEQVELLRGSNSVIWGSDALGGVMNLTTQRHDGVAGMAEYGGEERLTLGASGGLSGEIGNIALNAGYVEEEGFSSFDGGAEADGFEQFYLTGRGRLAVSDSFAIVANARYADSKLDIDGFAPPTFAFGDTNERQDSRDLSGRVGIEYDYQATLQVRAGFAHADIERDQINLDFGTTPYFSTDGTSNRAEVFARYDIADRWTLNAGGNYEWTRFSDGALVAQAEIRSAHSLLTFQSLDDGYGKVIVSAGARIDDHSQFGSEVSLGASGLWEFSDGWRARASYGEGFKAPTLFQLLSDFGNTALQPARSKAYDLGVGYSGRLFDVAFSLFRRDTSNLIDFVSCFGISDPICINRPFGTYDNVGRARAEGFEIEASASLGDKLIASANYAYLDAENRSAGSVNQGNRLARRPRNTVTFSADWTSPWAGLNLGADLRMVGDSFDDADNFTRLDGYVLTDIRAALPFDENVELFARIENLFDEQYQTAAGFGTQGRAAFVGLRASL